VSPPLPPIHIIINSGVNHRKDLYASDIPTYKDPSTYDSTVYCRFTQLSVHISIKDLIKRKIYGMYT